MHVHNDICLNHVWGQGQGFVNFDDGEEITFFGIYILYGSWINVVVHSKVSFLYYAVHNNAWFISFIIS